MNRDLRSRPVALKAALAVAAALGVLAGRPAAGAPDPTGAPRGVDAGGAAVQREEVFAFTAEPTCRKLGKDRFEIRFASKGWCDVAVDVVDARGRVVRHVVAGVLGSNAPEPLAASRLDQTIVWDGKNDLGRYVESPETCRVRVRLGLNPVFDKLLMWHPNRLPWAIWGLACDADGVYVLSTEGNPTMNTAHQAADLTHIQIYDHQGNYRKTILPLPAAKVTPEAYAPSPMHAQPPRAGKPKAAARPYGLVLPTGKMVISPTPNGEYFKYLESKAFLVADGLITAVTYPGPHSTELGFFRLKTDGAMPEGGFYARKLGDRGGQGPCWIAASPDRKWLYLCGLGARSRNWHTMDWSWNVRRRQARARHAVYRIRYDLTQPLGKPFLGVQDTPGGDERHFRFPEGVACDGQGRIYVADKGNNRVQVFSPAGKLVKSIAVPEPYQTAVCPKTGAIYILSYPVKLRKLSLIKLAGLADPTERARLTLKAKKLGTTLLPTFCLDTWADEPTVWLVSPDYHVQLWVDKGSRFERKRDLHDDLARDWKGRLIEQIRPSSFRSDLFMGNLTADPYRPYLYLGNSRGGGPMFRGHKAPRVQVETGEVEVVLGATVIGYDGLAYVRDGQQIRRFDPATGKPVAFDYGAGKEGLLDYKFSSADGIGFGVSPHGKVIYHDRWPPVPGVVKTHEQFHVMGLNKMRIPSYMRQKRWAYGRETSLRGYPMRQFFPGQVYKASGTLLVYDESGQMKVTDLVGGLPRVSAGVRMDVHGNVWVGVPMAKRAAGGLVQGYSVVKFGPAGGRFVVGGPGVPIPLVDRPKRPADFKPMHGAHPTHGDAGPHGERGFGDEAWAEGMRWSWGGYFPFNHTKCVCLNSRFDLDFHGRAFIPEGHRNSVSVIDTNGNFILRLGGYGNQDDRGPEVRLAHCRYLAVNDKRLYLNDVVNKRIVSVDLEYHQDVTVDIRQGD